MASSKIFGITILRQFSSSAVKDQLVKAPLDLFGVEGRYATALYSAATKQKQLDTVEKDLNKLKDIFASDKIFSEFLLNPVVSKNAKITAIKQASAKLSLSSSSINLLGLLAENGRLKNLGNIINLFKMLMAAHRGDLNIEVVTAQKLESDILQELEATLKKFAKKNEKVQISYKIKPEIMGGMIVSIGDKYVDLSTASKLKKYSDILKDSV
ncbi:hypothetical protein PGB90_001898 [Kerria lacca]